jgi:hypothetical protein
VVHFVRRQGTAKIGRWVAFGPSGGNRVAKHHAAKAAQPLRGFKTVRALHAAQHVQNFGSGDFGNRLILITPNTI